MSHLIFDCETAGLPEDQLIIPKFEAPGNYKDAVKIAESVREQKSKWLERTALSPLSGRILAIGIMEYGEFTCLDGDGDEKSILLQFEEEIRFRPNHQFVGFNILGFDLPFLQKRAWLHGVKPVIRHDFDSYRQDQWVDLMWLWANKNRNEFTSLDTVAKFLGVGQKTGDGKDFAKLWESDRAKTLEYLRNDLQLCADVAVRMGVVEVDRPVPVAF